MLYAGFARREITPFWGVELTGWGYYLERRWREIHDPLYATALACSPDESGESGGAIVVALDLMVIDEAFTQRTRERIARTLGLSPHTVLLTCSHSHNAPAAGGLLGVGACDPLYEQWAAQQAATAAILAWRDRQPARLRLARTTTSGLTFNRTRPDGVVDDTLTVAVLETEGGEPFGVVVNFAAHPTVCTELRPFAVSRDVPGMLCDRIESAWPGCTAMYIQGACGDTNFRREFQDASRCREPAERLWTVVRHAVAIAEPSRSDTVAAISRTVRLPTRRWTREEIEADRREAERRLKTGDISGWESTLGRAMTNRPRDMVARHGGDEHKAVMAMCRFHMEWTGRMLADFERRPEELPTEVQGVRIGDWITVSNAAELFSPFARQVRADSHWPWLMIACYANGRIGYLPDAYDIRRRSYAAWQSPKYCDQFPFTERSGPEMVAGKLSVIDTLKDA
ncbi:MAG: hypothetical protein D6725_10745 [Planctomycetota bacterium]|nr:MAG: hypothetical protein D6725_10745 [Planctomycetota bacterium]